MGKQTNPAVLLVLLACCGLSAFPSAAAAENEIAQDMARSPVRRVEGPPLLVELVPMPARYQILGGELLDLFTTSADSVFRVGPSRPNPHSWLSPSVICGDLCSFQVVFGTEKGAPIDTLDFVGVKPATYRVQVGDSPRPDPGIYIFRYLYGGEVIDEFKIDIRDPR